MIKRKLSLVENFYGSENTVIINVKLHTLVMNNGNEKRNVTENIPLQYLCFFSSVEFIPEGMFLPRMGGE
jgi:hypothetical protein